MLLKFGVSNHRSIAEKAEISFVASSLRDDETSLIRPTSHPEIELLPAIVLYGPNASGKTSLVEAFAFMTDSIRMSHAGRSPDDGVPVEPFALDTQYKDKPSEFVADFIHGGIRYQYGFAATSQSFVKEWLYSWPKQRHQLLFERGDGSIEFGRSLKGKNKVIESLMRPNSLFLSAAAQNQHEQLLPIRNYFASTVQTRSSGIEGRRPIDRRTIDFLTRIGTGIVDYRLTKQAMTTSTSFQEELSAVFKKHLPPGESFELPKEIQILELAHGCADGSPVYLAYEQESRGTQRLINTLDSVFQSLDSGGLVIVDELNLSLHTLAAEALLALYRIPSMNPRGAQLLATTHDTNLLKSNHLRRDQVWFVEKDQRGATVVFPLTDITTRKGDNIEKGYLQGRYGAIPFAGTVEELFDER